MKKNKQIKAPYGQTFPLLQPLRDVECWNFTGGEKFTLPAGLLLKVEHVHDATHTTTMLVDAEGEAPGIELGTNADATKKIGYRFIVENQALGEAIGVPMPKKTRDLVGEIMRYESGKATPTQEKKLFGHLRRTGLGRRLQGHYSSKM